MIFDIQTDPDKSEQTSLDEAPLRRIPTLMLGEVQLPSGLGEEPPSQPSFEGMEQDLPVVLQADQFDPDTGEIY
ncbi:hypothetical protein QPL15_21105 [Escherichia coli]|uniref:hypothetical protein n=1 Tax=Escherichia coli TaxID=562 RepID=UPI00287A422B|nr:hypothetical protein [Escherichia coli]MDS1745285.1 hypothetical protein [Escherichia coli]